MKRDFTAVEAAVLTSVCVAEGREGGEERGGPQNKHASSSVSSDMKGVTPLMRASRTKSLKNRDNWRCHERTVTKLGKEGNDKKLKNEETHEGRNKKRTTRSDLNTAARRELSVCKRNLKEKLRQLT